jgi:tetratricopeptide (TPR) repeat protein
MITLRFPNIYREVVEIMQRYVDIKMCVYDVHTREAAAALTMLLISMVNFATFLALKGAHDKSFEMLRSAEEMSDNVKAKDLRNFVKSMISNNMANFYCLRKKYNATARYARDSFQHWKKLNSVDGSLYFLLKYATANCLAGKYNDATEAMPNVIMLLEEAETLKGKGQKPPFQISFKQPHMYNETDFENGLETIAKHNHAITLCAMRKYNQALQVCDEALDISRETFNTDHVWLKQILRTHDFVTRQSQSATYDDFKLKPEEIIHKELQNKSRTVKRQMENDITVRILDVKFLIIFRISVF